MIELKNAVINWLVASNVFFILFLVANVRGGCDES